MEVIRKEYKPNKGEGRGVIAKNLGIKPESKEFHKLKKANLTPMTRIRGMGRGKSKGKREKIRV